MQLIYEGKGKKVFQAPDLDQVILFFKNDLTAFNALKKGSFEQKGAINCKIATLIFKILKDKNVNSHWIETLSDTEMRVKKTTIIPLEVVVRNFAAGSFAKKFEIKDGEKFSHPLIEYYYKNDALKDPFVSESQIFHFHWCTAEQLEKINAQSLKINLILSEAFAKRGLKLVDFKIEFGTTAKGELLLSDEISPDCMRLWDEKTGERLDKDRFRLDLGDVKTGYQRVLTELQALL